MRLVGLERLNADVVAAFIASLNQRKKFSLDSARIGQRCVERGKWAKLPKGKISDIAAENRFKFESCPRELLSHRDGA